LLGGIRQNLIEDDRIPTTLADDSKHTVEHRAFREAAIGDNQRPRHRESRGLKRQALNGPWAENDLRRVVEGGDV